MRLICRQGPAQMGPILGGQDEGHVHTRAGATICFVLPSLIKDIALVVKQSSSICYEMIRA
jgi:hypothetical protein